MNKAAVLGIMLVMGLVGFVFGKSMQDTNPRVPAEPLSSSGAALQKLPSSVELMSQSDAADHRNSRYANISTVATALELPTDFARTEALYALAGRANSEQLRQLIQQAANVDQRYERSSALRILFSRFIELNPDEAVDYLLAIHLDIDTMVLPDMFLAWAKSDLPRAIKKANSIDNVRQRKLAGNAILRAVARSDMAMLTQVEAQLDGNYRLAYLRSEAIGILSNSDPATALQMALAMDSQQARWDALRRVSAVWARNDPAAALAYAIEIADHKYRSHFVSTVLERWMGDDPESALEMIQATENAALRADMIEKALRSYAAAEPEAALQVAGQLAGKDSARAQDAIFSTWVVNDPAAAYAALDAYPDRKDQLLRNMSISLSSRGGNKIMQWIDLLEPKERAKILPDVVSQISHSNPTRALDLALTHMSRSQQRNHLPQVLSSIATSDPILATQYLSELPIGTNKDYVYRQVATQFASKDPQAAVEWMESLTGKRKITATVGLIQTLASSDSALSSRLISALPASERAKVMKQVGMQFSINAPAAGVEWLDQYRHLEGYDAALANTLPFLVREDPRRALRLADGLNDKAKEKAMSSIVQSWAQQDNEAATNWALEQASGAIRDRAIMGLVGNSGTSQNDLHRLINKIDSDKIRDNAIVQGYIQIIYKDNDTEAAETFLAQYNASDELKRKIEVVRAQFPGL